VKTVGKYVHNSVPVHQDEEHNVVLRTWGDDKKFREPALAHHEALLKLDGYDSVRGPKLAGHRGLMLTGWGIFLKQALVNYGLEFLATKGTLPLSLPPAHPCTNISI
jgi:seryl-tRNA synthetase